MKLQFYFEARCLPRSPVPMHTHQAFELVYYTEGTGRTTIGRVTHRVRPFVFALIPAGVAHDQKNQTQLISICLGVSGWKFKAGVWTDAGGTMRQPLSWLLRELEQKGPGHESICTGLLHQIQGLILRCQQRHEAPPLKRALVQRAIEVIDRRAGRLTVTEMARELYVSRDYLRHLFQEYAGESPLQRILKARMERAKELLSTRGLRVGEIAAQCGFENVYYFSRFFRKATGRTPSQYRQSVIKG